jgi:hypothetical protein
MGGQLVHERAPPSPRCALASHPAHGGGFLPELGRIWPRQIAAACVCLVTLILRASS